MSDEKNKIGMVCWNELATPDLETAKAFYTQMFGWTAENMEGPMPFAVGRGAQGRCFPSAT